MNTQHTPGNWYAEGDVVFSDVGTRVADCACNENDEREMPEGEEEANARLIAESPELLKIAKAYRNLLRTAAQTDGEVSTFAHIEAVIARVEA